MGDALGLIETKGLVACIEALAMKTSVLVWSPQW